MTATEPAHRPVSQFDPHDPELAPRQHEVLADLLERCPVSWSDRHGGFWSVARFDDVVQAARDHPHFTAERGVIVPSLGASTPIPPAQVDPPEHTKYRKLLLPFFGPRQVPHYTELIRDIVRRTVGEFRARGHAELASELAHPVPTVALAAILGLPRDQWRLIRDLVDDYLLAATLGDQEKRRAAGALEDFVHRVVDERRGDPERDVLARIVNSEIDGEPVPDHMLRGMVHVLITAGHETTINGIANVVSHALTVPGLWQRLRADRGLIPAVINESLRLESPVMCMARTVVEPTELGEVALAAEEKVVLLFGAANLDPSRFPDPHTFTLDRGTPHIAFGSGPHRCAGEHLAVLEIRIVLEELLDTLPDLRVAHGAAPVWGSGAVRRGVRELRVQFTPAGESGTAAVSR